MSTTDEDIHSTLDAIEKILQETKQILIARRATLQELHRQLMQLEAPEVPHGE
jgi:hypothetical protein